MKYTKDTPNWPWLLILIILIVGGGVLLKQEWVGSAKILMTKPDSVKPFFTSISNLTADSLILSAKHRVQEEIAIKRRYFLVSYMTCEKGGKAGDIMGNKWFSVTGGFFNVREFDSLVYSVFPKKRKCYESILIVSIYEFKTEEDYSEFNHDAVSSGVFNGKKKECCTSEIPVFKMDTSPHILNFSAKTDSAFSNVEHYRYTIILPDTVINIK